MVPHFMKNAARNLMITSLLGIALTTLAQEGGRLTHKDLVYQTGGHERQKLDLYLPADAKGPLPLILWIHGGGWQAGSKQSCLPLQQGYVGRGYAVASLGYRLSGHATFPAQIQDCRAAIRWLRVHAAEYRLDPERFAVWGSSAGGHLAAMVGTVDDSEGFDVGDNLEVSARVQAVCDYYGPTDFKAFVTTPGYEGHAKPDSPESKLIGGTVLEHPDRIRAVNPITYVTPQDPPFLIVHGEQDRTVPPGQSLLLHEALVKAGVSSHLHRIEGAGHGGPAFSTDPVRGMVAEFLERHLKGQGDSSPLAKTTQSIAPEGSNESRRNANRNLPLRLNFDLILRREDTNQDGKISRAEFRGPAALWQRWDLDGNGELTREEHTRATQR